MAGQTKEIPNQRGTSSGEIGQNPVEIIGKQPVQAGSEPANKSNVDEKDSSKKD